MKRGENESLIGSYLEEIKRVSIKGRSSDLLIGPWHVGPGRGGAALCVRARERAARRAR